MAIVIANPFGELRGKLGGMVFSATRGRKIVRSYSIPIQPDTDAQLEARSSFGAAAQSYHGLTDIQKAVWNSYAGGIFNAKDSYNDGQYSGANAFVSLKNLVNMSARVPLDLNMENDAAGVLDGDPVSFIFNNNPPTDQLAANIQGAVVGTSYPMSLSNIVIGADGKFEIGINFDGVLAAGLGQDDTKDQNGTPFGFAVYVSNVVNQDHNYVSNPAMQLIGIMPGISGSTLIGLSTSASMKIINTNAIDTSKYQSFGQEDDQIQVKVYTISDSGMVACIGGKMTTIVATS